MRKLLLVAPFLFVFSLAHADPPDVKALPDGGSIVQPVLSTDGGVSPSVITINTGQTQDWIATLRARSSCGSPSVYYLFSTDAGVATANDSFLQVDHTFDLPISQGNVDKYSWVSFLGEDGGPPCVTVHRNPLR